MIKGVVLLLVFSLLCHEETLAKAVKGQKETRREASRKEIEDEIKENLRSLLAVTEKENKKEKEAADTTTTETEEDKRTVTEDIPWYEQNQGKRDNTEEVTAAENIPYYPEKREASGLPYFHKRDIPYFYNDVRSMNPYLSRYRMPLLKNDKRNIPYFERNAIPYFRRNAIPYFADRRRSIPYFQRNAIPYFGDKRRSLPYFKRESIPYFKRSLSYFKRENVPYLFNDVRRSIPFFTNLHREMSDLPYFNDIPGKRDELPYFMAAN